SQKADRYDGRVQDEAHRARVRISDEELVAVECVDADTVEVRVLDTELPRRDHVRVFEDPVLGVVREVESGAERVPEIGAGRVRRGRHSNAVVKSVER